MKFCKVSGPASPGKPVRRLMSTTINTGTPTIKISSASKPAVKKETPYRRSSNGLENLEKTSSRMARAGAALILMPP